MSTQPASAPRPHGAEPVAEPHPAAPAAYPWYLRFSWLFTLGGGILQVLIGLVSVVALVTLVTLAILAHRTFVRRHASTPGTGGLEPVGARF